MISRGLPYSRHHVDDADIAAVVQALRSTCLTTGPLVDRFEEAFCKATGAGYAVACNSGTAALHLAAMASHLGPGLAAVVPAITFVATANAVRMTGAEVVFADVDDESGLLTAQTFRKALDRAYASGLKVAAALPVHLNGQFCDMAAIASIAREHGIALIEDACHALGEPRVGATPHSRAACFSTHPAKAITTGEGGVVTTNDSRMAEHMRRLRSHGMVRDPAQFVNHGDMDPVWPYQMTELGWNYRIPEISCALGLSQLTKLSGFMMRRRSIASLYDRLFQSLGPAIRPTPRRSDKHGWHLYVLLIDFRALKVTRARLMDWLWERGIGTQIHYVPVHRQPYYRRRYGELSLRGADAYYESCLSIPFFPSMTDDDVHRVAEAFHKIFQGSASQ